MLIKFFNSFFILKEQSRPLSNSFINYNTLFNADFPSLFCCLLRQFGFALIPCPVALKECLEKGEIVFELLNL